MIVTGDNWDEGRGLRRQGELLDADVIINVFNVDKINKDVGPHPRTCTIDRRRAISTISPTCPTSCC